jgi:hypothetical protein
MRLESERFRNRLHQLNDKLTETRSDRETMDLIEAIQSDAFHLSEAFGQAVELVPAPFHRPARALIWWLATLLPWLEGADRAELTPEARRRLRRRLREPHLHFLSEIRERSREITNAMPSVQRLWHPSIPTTDFVKRFQAVGELRS